MPTINTDVLAAARGVAYDAARELGAVLPESQLRTEVLGDLNDLAERFDTLMAENDTGELEIAADPDAVTDDVDLAEPARPPTKAELLDRAAELEIDGRTSMTKAQLTEAIATAEASGAGED